MTHETQLIATLAVGLGLAFVFGMLAVRLRLPPVVGYLLAGVAAGPFTPGYVADSGLAGQMAEIGVILLMFGVGTHFSIGELLAVRRIAVPGAVLQIACATALGALLAHGFGWSWTAGAVFGVSLSVASTIVLLRALEARRIVDTPDGRIAIGWLVVEDLITVLVLVMLPALAPRGEAGGSASFGGMAAAVALTIGKAIAFGASMFLVGRRVVPWLLVRAARTGSRELFTLAVLSLALGIALGASALFGVTFALGAFLAGVVVGETELSHSAASDALPMQDAFGVLFFVAVGMLFDPHVLTQHPWQVAGVVAVVVVGKSIAALVIVLARGYPLQTALTVAASLGQIGEFSFIVSGLGRQLGLLPHDAESLLVAGALISITLNPLLFARVPNAAAWLRGKPRLLAMLERPGGPLTELPRGVDPHALRDHAILVGHGRVGAPVAAALARRGIPLVVIEHDHAIVEALRRDGVTAIHGDAARPSVLDLARIGAARLVVVTAPEPAHTRAIVSHARSVHPSIRLAARTHSEEEARWLRDAGVGVVIVAENVVAEALVEHAAELFDARADSDSMSRS